MGNPVSISRKKVGGPSSKPKKGYLKVRGVVIPRDMVYNSLGKLNIMGLYVKWGLYNLKEKVRAGVGGGKEGET